jgi:uncharacterized protein (DUF1800 family)
MMLPTEETQVLKQTSPGIARQSCRLGFLIAACVLVSASSNHLHAAGSPSLTNEQRILHVLNRLGFGARPGDLERVKAMGLDKYLRQQLHPETIDDSVLEKKLSQFNVLNMSATELMEAFREEQREAQERRKARAEMEKQRGTNASPEMAEAPDRRMNVPKPSAMGNSAERPTRLAVGQLQNEKIIRAVESERQLNEVLVDFWSNHFNIDMRKGPCRVLKVVDEREVIRPHVLGKFRDLLKASAKSPAMLVYLDNAQNSAPRELPAMEPRNRQRQAEPATNALPRRAGGINENYARELMELHTLGVDGGYTQKDVQEVARCLTGWSFDARTGRFQFRAGRHDNSPKTVLGHPIPASGGIKDGEKVLDILASHPSTAKFIATKLCRRFVADDPPPALVARVATVFQATDGDLRKVTEAIIFSQEFFSAAAYRSKIRSPFEYVVSAVRAAGGRLDTTGVPSLDRKFAMETASTFGRAPERLANARRKSLNVHISEMGQPLFAYQAPTGYPEDSRKWVNTGALIARMNFALALTGRNLLDVNASPNELLQGIDIDKPDLVIDRLNRVLLHGQLTPATRATLEKQLAGKANTVNVAQITALMLGSPEFQRR